MGTRTILAVLMGLGLVALGGCTLVGYPSGRGEVAPIAGSAPGSAPSREGGPRYEVFGRSYQVLTSAEGYRERGRASWYGQAFHGRPTASGETYDMHGLSAAHRTLPLDTWVEVVNLDNGRRLVLRINDRGPFARVDERILDLSYGAARELGVVGPGTAAVEVRALSASERANQR